MQAGRTRSTVDVRRTAKHCPTCAQRFSRDAAFCPFDGVKLEDATFDPSGDPLVGVLVDGRYDVLGVLGEGGMGRVYEVRHAALERTFAMKVLRPDLAREEELAERFIREAKATASVKHPNVVQITDFGRLPDAVPYFVMELLVGRTLGEVIKASGPVPHARAIRIVRKVAGALGAAHEAGIVHRDLKPDNVFLVDDNRSGPASVWDVRVVDFGAAKIVGSSRMTRAGVVFGTPHYMSPEQASGQPVDYRTDVYALGVIMYEMFTGRVPFEADTYMGVLTQHMFVQPEPPSQISEAAQELGELERITLTCLAKRPEDRFASMADLLRAIDAAVLVRSESGRELPGSIETRDSRRPPAGILAPVLAFPGPGEEDTLPQPMTSGASRPAISRLWVAVGVAALLVAILATKLFARHEGSTDIGPAAPSAAAVPTEPASRPAPEPSPTPSGPAAEASRVSGPAAPEVLPSGAASVPPHPVVHHHAPAPSDIRGTIDDVGDPFAGKR
jgi:serine/threonine protein kinase